MPDPFVYKNLENLCKDRQNHDFLKTITGSGSETLEDGRALSQALQLHSPSGANPCRPRVGNTDFTVIPRESLVCVVLEK